jgi:serine/threonine protein kinase
MSENDLQVRAEKRIGTVLCGKYRVERVLGVGGMAVVYAATHRNQKRVAVKMLHPELAIHGEIRARFLREGYAANTVDHPGAVAVLDDDVAEDGAAFLVMERLEGEEVDRLWEQRDLRLAVDVVLSIASQLLDVLVAAHAKSIIHRDIKPANLYITTDGTLKVLDFGIARLRDAAAGGQAATGTGMMLGTPAYMAPEQALGKSREIDGTTDNWSVGATMFSLLSGFFVHEGESATELVVRSATQPARSLAVVAPQIDRRVVEIVDRALGFEKSARWPNALAMRDAVRAAYAGIFGSKVGKEPLERIVAQTAAWTGHTTPLEVIQPPTTPPPRVSNPPVALTPKPRLEPTRDMTALPRGPALRQAPPPEAPSPTRDMSMMGTPAAGRASAWSASPPPERPGGEGRGASTARPVEANASIMPDGLPRPASRLLVIGLVAGATLLVVVGIGWMTLSRGSSGSNVTANAPAPTDTVITLAPASAAPSPVVLEAAAPVVETRPPAAVQPARPAPAPANPAPVAPSKLLPAPVIPFIPVPASRPATPPNCDPPFTVNLSGHRVPKPECL